MKRFFAVFVTLILLFSMTLGITSAAETGEMLIASEKVTGTVGAVVEVEFYLYPNLPDERKLDSLSGMLKFDPEFLTFGTINLTDEEKNLSSLMNGKASNFQFHEKEPGEIRFAFSDAYGVDAEGFWFQAEFRIEKEGATEFIFNGISYAGLKTIKNEDGSTTYNTISYTIEPVSRGGIYTEGEAMPTDSAPSETFEPLAPVIQTPAPVTPTPRPSNGGQTVPVTSELPTFSAEPSFSTNVPTLQPQITSIPMRTPAPEENTPVPSQGTGGAPASDGVSGTDDNPIGTGSSATGEPRRDPVTGEIIDVTEQPVTSENQRGETSKLDGEDSSSTMDILLMIGIVVGIVAVIALGVLAIVLILKRRNMSE